jgi:hypothetical protein
MGIIEELTEKIEALKTYLSHNAHLSKLATLHILISLRAEDWLWVIVEAEDALKRGYLFAEQIDPLIYEFAKSLWDEWLRHTSMESPVGMIYL